MSTDVLDSAGASEVGAVRRAFRETATAIREVTGSSSLRRLELALAGSMIGDWAYATAVTVWAYGAGGAKAVGLWTAIRLVLMSVSAPFAAAFADKLPRKLVLISSDLSRCVLVAGAAACIAAGTPSAPVYVLATLTSLLGCVFRPAQAAWTPSLADRPEQLTAANGVSSTIESLAFFIGPALGVALLAGTNVETVFVVDAATFLWSAALVFSITARPAESSADAADDEGEDGGLAMMFAGFREIFRSRDLRLVAALVSLQTIIAGASAVFTVLFAVDYLGSGARGLGYVNAVLGVGAVIGGFIAIGRSARRRLGLDLNIGVLLWSLPLLLVVAWPSAASVFVAVALLGLANPLVDVNFATAVQSVTPDRVIGRVFGAMEGLLIATMAVGAAVMPFLVDGVGLRTTLAILALVVAVPTACLLPAARALDSRLRPPAGLALLQALPIFAPLGPARIDALARELNRSEVAAETVIVTEGERGDLFYLIESGRVSVAHGGLQVREEGPGEYFGEIALLRDVPRTATVTALEDTVLLTLTRTSFLDAVTGNDEAAQLVEDVISYRMRF